jgi:hypothetical protein
MPQDDFDKIESAARARTNKKDVTIAQLEKNLEKCKDESKQERFYWSLATIIALDVYIFNQSNFYAASFVFILELLFLCVWARACQVEGVSMVLDRILARVWRGNGD